MKEIVTWDGTEFKQGMISGGQHKNIFSVNLGQMTLDRDIKKLSDEISHLHASLSEMSSQDEDLIQRVLKDISRIETEQEILQHKLTDIDR